MPSTPWIRPEVTGFDAHEVWPNIWVGSKPDPHDPLKAFQLVVLCAREYQPTMLAFEGRVLNPAFDDAEPTQGQVRRALQASQEVAVAASKGHRCLVTCWAGLNRSALVAGLAMLQLSPKLTVPEVLVLMRTQRNSSCLSNEHFVQLLHRAAATRTRF